MSSFVIAILGINVIFSSTLSSKEAHDFIGLLSTCSGMAFTISGIWVAYIYPEAVTSIVTRKKASSIEDNEEYKRVSAIVGVIVLSGFVLSSLLIMSFSMMIIDLSLLSPLAISVLKHVACFILTSLTFAQLGALYIVLASCVNFVIDLQRQAARKNLDGKIGLLKSKNSDES